MTRYAQFDPSVKAPSPVIGWYDTTILDYPNLPDASSLVQVDDSDWALHFGSLNGWAVVDGKLIAPEP